MTEGNKTFIVSLRYLEPVEGTSYITAPNEEVAREKAAKLFSWHKSFEIVDVVESSEPQMILDLKAEAEEKMLDQFMNESFPTNPKKEDIN